MKTVDTPEPPGPEPTSPFGARLALELVTVAPPDGGSLADVAQPFVMLEGRGPFSRTLLARVVGPSGQSLRDFALRVQRDDYPIGELPGWSNRDVDEQWDHQWRLWTAAAQSGGAPRIIDVLPPLAGGAPRLPPTLYCKERRVCFEIHCPSCAAKLQTCHDDALLTRSNLPAFSASLERFLYCSSCEATGQPPRFYALMLSDPSLRDRAPVVEQADLYRALGALALSGGPWPCGTCANRSTCYTSDGTGDAVRFLTPVSFYDFRCIPHERFDLLYDDFAALLGGQTLLEAGPDPDEASRRPHWQQLRGQRFLFEDDPKGKLSLEVFRLKLALFAQLVTAVSEVHRTTGLPHLGLSPAAITVALGDAAPDLPRYYAFHTRIVDVGGATFRRVSGLDVFDLKVPLLDPPPLTDETYAAPLVTEGPSAFREGLLTFTALEPGGDKRWIVQAELSSEMLDPTPLSEHDVIQVAVRQARPFPLTLELITNPIGTTAGSVRLRSLPVEIPVEMAKQIQTLPRDLQIRATFAVHPCLHTPCDVQSLGLLLFATLTSNEAQRAGAVGAAARRIATAITRFAHDHPNSTRADVAAYAVTLLSQSEQVGVLGRRHVFDQPAEHEGAGDKIPLSLWQAALVIGLRALTQTPEFGFCRRHDDFDPLHPEGPADKLAAELDVLIHKVDEELYGMRGKRAVFAQAVARAGNIAATRASGATTGRPER